jgi:hypothetical protein
MYSVYRVYVLKLYFKDLIFKGRNLITCVSESCQPECLTAGTSIEAKKVTSISAVSMICLASGHGLGIPFSTCAVEPMFIDLVSRSHFDMDPGSSVGGVTLILVDVVWLLAWDRTGERILFR